MAKSVRSSQRKQDYLSRVLTLGEIENDIVVEFDATQLNQNNFQLLQQLPEIIQGSGEIGQFELDIFKITIHSLETYETH